jgi:hypothetical protein
VIAGCRIMRFSFLIYCVIGVALPAHAAAQTASERTVHRLTIGLFERRDTHADSAARSSSYGVTLGIEEAQRTAKLFGWEVAVVRLPDSLYAFDVGNAERSGVTAIVGDLTSTATRKQRGASGPLLFDIGEHSSRAAPECSDRAFQLLSANEVNAVAWHPALERFGAGQLNDRFRKRFGTEMDERAWAGWMSIKILLDAALKTRTSNECALERFLLSAEGRFDGHKGVPLYFDPATRELVQPRYTPRPSGEPEVVGVPNAQNGRGIASATVRARCVEACG